MFSLSPKLLSIAPHLCIAHEQSALGSMKLVSSYIVLVQAFAIDADTPSQSLTTSRFSYHDVLSAEIVLRCIYHVHDERHVIVVRTRDAGGISLGCVRPSPGKKNERPTEATDRATIDQARRLQLVHSSFVAGQGPACRDPTTDQPHRPTDHTIGQTGSRGSWINLLFLFFFL